jgi:hypothetical protein
MVITPNFMKILRIKRGRRRRKEEEPPYPHNPGFCAHMQASHA